MDFQTGVPGPQGVREGIFGGPRRILKITRKGVRRAIMKQLFLKTLIFYFQSNLFGKLNENVQ